MLRYVMLYDVTWRDVMSCLGRLVQLSSARLGSDRIGSARLRSARFSSAQLSSAQIRSDLIRSDHIMTWCVLTRICILFCSMSTVDVLVYKRKACWPWICVWWPSPVLSLCPRHHSSSAAHDDWIFDTSCCGKSFSFFSCFYML